VELPVYLDNLATTRVDPAVLEAMLPWFTREYGNPASRTHAFGWRAAEAVEIARAEVAALIGVRQPREIVFTSGATEANNLAILGVTGAYRDHGDHVITQATEHRSVRDPAAGLARRGGSVTVLPVDGHGRVDPEAVRAALTRRTVLISVMAANNEVGTLQPLAEIAGVAREAGVLLHCDAAQAVGKVPLAVESLGIDLLSLSGHKVYAGKGVGALWVRSRQPRVRLRPLVEGGGQERGLRSGTLNVPGIVGLGRACALAREELAVEAVRVSTLRDRLHRALEERLGPLPLNGHPRDRLPGCLNLSFPGVDGASLITAFRDLALSAGSACTSGETTPSYVLRAMGVSDDLAAASLRFGLGRFTTVEEVDYAAARVVEEVERLRRTG
jgi:cysteine desulfurase